MVGKLGGALALSVVLWFSVDWTAALAVLAKAGRWLILAAFLASVANILISAGKWQILLRRSRVRLGYAAAAQLYWIGAFFSNFLPTGVGGDAVRLMMTPSDNGRVPVATRSGSCRVSRGSWARTAPGTPAERRSTSVEWNSFMTMILGWAVHGAGAAPPGAIHPARW